MMTEPHDNPPKHRFELEADGEIAFAAHEIDGDTITFTHTIVPPALEGQGVASRLIAYALSEVRKCGLKVVPQCSFVAAYMKRHPETEDLRS